MDIAADYQGQLLRPYSGQEIDMKGLHSSLECKVTFVKTWGLKSRVLYYWIYTMVIRPILTYCSTVW